MSHSHGYTGRIYLYIFFHRPNFPNFEAPTAAPQFPPWSWSHEIDRNDMENYEGWGVISRKPLEVTNRSFGKKRQPVMFVGEIPLATIYFRGQMFVFKDLWFVILLINWGAANTTWMFLLRQYVNRLSLSTFDFVTLSILWAELWAERCSKWFLFFFEDLEIIQTVQSLAFLRVFAYGLNFAVSYPDHGLAVHEHNIVVWTLIQDPFKATFTAIVAFRSTCKRLHRDLAQAKEATNMYETWAQGASTKPVAGHVSITSTPHIVMAQQIRHTCGFCPQLIRFRGQFG